MGLTKPRAAQIFNLDYKQSTRVVTTATVNLAGGAPSSVDGVNLSAGDRVLVTVRYKVRCILIWDGGVGSPIEQHHVTLVSILVRRK